MRGRSAFAGSRKSKWPVVAGDFAGNLAKWRDQGVPDLVFLIGGAEGYGDAVKSAVPETLAFGPQTWPHRFVRVMLSEQVYRAVSILAGTPYHKD